MKLSVIIPFVNEHPQVLFTVQSIFTELYYDARFDWEIIAINNCCDPVRNQPAQRVQCPQCNHDFNLKRGEDRGGQKLSGYANLHKDRIKYIAYGEKLSHWQAKNQGVAASSGDMLFFCDAHCMVTPWSLVRMTDHYFLHKEKLHGTLHLPLLYMLDHPKRSLIYKPVIDTERGLYHYSFTRYREDDHPYIVAAMSTCGMMMSRKIYDSLGGWPTELGIYGGGENFINYTLAILGYHKWIYPGPPLIHYAEKRGYSWNASDYIRNRLIATYMYGGESLLELYSHHCKGRPKVIAQMCEDIVSNCHQHRTHIFKQQQINLLDWWEKFKSESKGDSI